MSRLKSQKICNTRMLNAKSVSQRNNTGFVNITINWFGFGVRDEKMLPLGSTYITMIRNWPASHFQKICIEEKYEKNR